MAKLIKNWGKKVENWKFDLSIHFFSVDMIIFSKIMLNYENNFPIIQSHRGENNSHHLTKISKKADQNMMMFIRQ